MDDTKNRDKFIEGKALSKTDNISAWKFQETGHLYVEEKDTGSYVGGVNYDNPIYEMGGAIKVCDWVFALERMTSEAREKLAPENDPNVWVIAAFHESSHYSFDGVEAPSKSELNNFLVKYVVENFWPIFHPEVVDAYIKKQSTKEKAGNKDIKWQIVML